MAFRLMILPTPHQHSVLDTQCKLFVRAGNGNHMGEWVLGAACRAEDTQPSHFKLQRRLLTGAIAFGGHETFTHLNK